MSYYVPSPQHTRAEKERARLAPGDQPMASEEQAFYGLRDSDWLDDPAVAAWLEGDSPKHLATGPSWWKISKKGNLWCQKFGATYTVVRATRANGQTGFRGVVVGPGGQRVDIEQQPTAMQVLELMWPEGNPCPLLGKVGRT